MTIASTLSFMAIQCGTRIPQGCLCIKWVTAQVEILKEPLKSTSILFCRCSKLRYVLIPKRCKFQNSISTDTDNFQLNTQKILQELSQCSLCLDFDTLSAVKPVNKIVRFPLKFRCSIFCMGCGLISVSQGLKCSQTVYHPVSGDMHCRILFHLSSP